MKGERKTKKQLMREVTELRRRITELEASEREHTLAEEALRDSEARNRALLNIMPDLMFEIGNDGTFLRYKPAIDDELALPPSGFLGRKVCETLPIEFAQQAMHQVEAALQTGDIQTFEYQLPVPLPNGDVRHYEGRIVASGEDAVLAIVRNITERVRAEEALRESEERLRAFMDSATDNVTLWDSELNLVEINKAALELFPAGTEKEEVIGKHMLDLAPDLEKTGRYDKYMEVMETGNPFYTEHYVPGIVKGEIQLDLRAFKVNDGMGMISTDITERVRAEEALRESVGRFRRIFESTKEGMVTCDPDGRIVSANPAAAAILGYETPEDLIGMLAIESYAHSVQTKAIFEELMEKGYIEDREITFTRRDGTLVHVLGSATVHRDEEGNILATEGIFRDFTERKQMQDALRQSEEKLKAQYKAIPIPTYTWQRVGEDLVLIDCNDAAVALMQGNAANLLGQKSRDMYHDCPEIVQELSRCLAEKTVIKREIECPFVTMGESKHFAVTYAFAAPNLVMVHAEDITDRKRSELAAEEERDRIAREMHDGLAQDLAALLLGVQRSLKLFDTDPLEVKEKLIRMEAALQDQIEELRRLILALRPLDLEELGFSSALHKLVDTSGAGSTLTIHLSGVEHMPRLGRELEFALFRVVQESLNNVRNHAQADSVWIDLALGLPDILSLTIRDNGRGFNFGEAMTEASSRGRLGLLHMRERVEALGGKLAVETAPTSGTKISVTLPINNPGRNSR